MTFTTGRGIRVHAFARSTVWLFTATTFTASALVFLVQPMFAKMVLPKLGGSPAVWNTCVLFFQASLLVGYLYAHLTTRWLGARRQAVVHLVLMTTALVFLPLRLGEEYPPAGSDPVWWLLLIMIARLGLPFLAVSTMAPLVQRWFATMPVPSASNPYFLYAASNAGSMLALLAYPLILEPFWGTRVHTELWQAGYVLLLVLVATCAWSLSRRGQEGRQAVRRGSVGWARRAQWTILAFIPSSLMLGVTTHISTDLAAIPLLWVLPLAAYLLTFILAFSNRVWIPEKLLASVLPVSAVAVIVSIIFQRHAPWIIPLHLVAFFCAALSCHTALVRSRPGTDDLTEFYVWLSFGGMLGGVFNSLIAPQLFNGIFEYPIVLALSCLVRPSPGYRTGRLEPWGVVTIGVVVPFIVFTAAWGLGRFSPKAPLSAVLIIASIFPAVLFALANRTVVFNGLMVLAAFLLPVAGSSRTTLGEVVFADRSFFGVSRVIEGPDRGYHLLQHGSTVHGRQNLPAGGACEAQSYYHAKGPVGDLFRAAGPFTEAGVVGLGSGGLSCYAQPGTSWTFFEIDPLVERIARDASLFTFLQNTRGQIVVKIGDGRKKLEEAAAASFDLIVIDAFSSDSIPVHLLTREALQLYLSRLKPGGVIALHISNRFIRLEPVVAAVVATTELRALVEFEAPIPSADIAHGRYQTHWVVITADEDRFDALSGESGWRPLRNEAGVNAWTDDYSNLLNNIQW
jgi:SAM-dependent methyltransferase